MILPPSMCRLVVNTPPTHKKTIPSNVDRIALCVSLYSLMRNSGLGDGHGSFYYSGNNVLHFSHAFQITASYKAPELVITWRIPASHTTLLEHCLRGVGWLSHQGK